MNKRFLFALVNILIMFMLVDITLSIVISQQTILENGGNDTTFKQILLVMSVILILVILVLLYRSIRSLLDRNYIPPAPIHEEDLLPTILGNIGGILYMKVFYLNFSKVNFIMILNIYFLINLAYVLIPTYVLIQYYRNRYQKDAKATILELKLLVERIAILGPITTVVALLFFSYTLKIGMQEKLTILFILMPIFLGTMLVYIYVNYRFKIITILLFKHAEDDQTNELITTLYEDPMALETYLNAKWRPASILAIVSTVLLGSIGVSLLLM